MYLECGDNQRAAPLQGGKIQSGVARNINDPTFMTCKKASTLIINAVYAHFRGEPEPSLLSATG